MNAALISVDWGSTTLRCALVSDKCKVLKQKASQQGILKTGGTAFADILHAEIQSWLGQFQGLRPVPIMMSGMIGSRQGWREAPYVDCPASIGALSRQLLQVDTAGTPLAGCDVRIVPGMVIPSYDELGQIPDVMRGEESQVLGALLDARKQSGIFVLPGTHSKWAFVDDGEIVDFETYMTGEVFSALLDATILGRLAEGQAYDHDNFVLGARLAIIQSDDLGLPGDLLNLVFSARARVLLGDMKPTGVHSYLSGLLIGAEVMSGLALVRLMAEEGNDDEHLHFIADEPLLSRYKTVAGLVGVPFSVVGGNPVARAHLELARAIGIVG